MHIERIHASANESENVFAFYIEETSQSKDVDEDSFQDDNIQNDDSLTIDGGFGITYRLLVLICLELKSVDSKEESGVFNNFVGSKSSTIRNQEKEAVNKKLVSSTAKTKLKSKESKTKKSTKNSLIRDATIPDSDVYR